MSTEWQDLDPVEREAILERMRQTGLRLDREGRWWHQGALIVHDGLASALHRWIDRLEDGRYVVRFDRGRYAYVEVEDAALIVKSVTLEPEGDGPIELHLSNGQTEELAYQTLKIGPQNALYCLVRGRLPARFSRQAYYLLGSRLVELESGGVALRAGGANWLIG